MDTLPPKNNLTFQPLPRWLQVLILPSYFFYYFPIAPARYLWHRGDVPSQFLAAYWYAMFGTGAAFYALTVPLIRHLWHAPERLKTVLAVSWALITGTIFWLYTLASVLLIVGVVSP